LQENSWKKKIEGKLRKIVLVNKTELILSSILLESIIDRFHLGSLESLYFYQLLGLCTKPNSIEEGLGLPVLGPI
jgi:hypothetical protein